jgi:hypothetical protein
MPDRGITSNERRRYPALDPNFKGVKEKGPNNSGNLTRLPTRSSVQESCKATSKSKVLKPVRFGQFVQLPASGTSVSSFLSKATDSSESKMFKCFVSLRQACGSVGGSRST